MKKLISKALRAVFFLRERWAKRTLVVGPVQPVDGDSVASTKALINHIRGLGKEAYTLPVLSMYDNIAWILTPEDLHPSIRHMVNDDFTTESLQAVYDSLLESWVPDEIVLVDGQADRIGFDLRGKRLFTIDHHLDKGERNDAEGYIQSAPSFCCLLIEKYRIYDPILAVSILTDTYWLRSNNPTTAARRLAELTEHGLTDELLERYQRRLMVQKDQRFLQAIQNAQIRFSQDQELAFAVIEESDPSIQRGVAGQLGYYSKHSCTVRGDGYVSFRTVDPCVDLRPIAEKYGRGGHRQQAAGQIDPSDPKAIDKLFLDLIELIAEDHKQCTLTP